MFSLLVSRSRLACSRSPYHERLSLFPVLVQVLHVYYHRPRTLSTPTGPVFPLPTSFALAWPSPSPSSYISGPASASVLSSATKTRLALPYPTYNSWHSVLVRIHLHLRYSFPFSVSFRRVLPFLLGLFTYIELVYILLAISGSSGCVGTELSVGSR